MQKHFLKTKKTEQMVTNKIDSKNKKLQFGQMVCPKCLHTHGHSLGQTVLPHQKHHRVVVFGNCWSYMNKECDFGKSGTLYGGKNGGSDMPLRQRAEPSATPIVTESIAGVETEDLDKHPSKSWCRADNKWESLPQLKLRRHPSGVACLELSMFYLICTVKTRQL